MLSIYFTQKSSIMTPLFWDWCRQQLPLNILHKIDRKRSKTKMQNSLLGYVLLKEVLKKNGLVNEIELLTHNFLGRPTIQGDFDFNISHSDEYVVCAFSRKHQVGIDIEKTKPISLDFIRTFFSPKEWQQMQLSQNSENSFYELWTKKEAVVKADGRGLTIPLKEIIIEHTQGFVEKVKWFLQEIPLNQNYRMHVATNEPIQEYLRVKISFR